MIDLDELERIARAAADGPVAVDLSDVRPGEYRLLAALERAEAKRQRISAEQYTSAGGPLVMLALIARIRELEAAS